MSRFDLNDEEFERFSQFLFSRGITSFALITVGPDGADDTSSAWVVKPACNGDEPDRLQAAVNLAGGKHSPADFNFLNQRQPLDCVATTGCKVGLR